MNLCIVSYTFQQGREFCDEQGIYHKRVCLISTDSVWDRKIFSVLLQDDDGIIKYGQYLEGKNVGQTLDLLESRKIGTPFEYEAYEAHEHIPWPTHLLESFIR